MWSNDTILEVRYSNWRVISGTVEHVVNMFVTPKVVVSEHGNNGKNIFLAIRKKAGNILIVLLFKELNWKTSLVVDQHYHIGRKGY